MKVCVTGGSGFIGTHLARALITEGRGVSVIDKVRPATSIVNNINIFQCDLTRSFNTSIFSADAVFHFAASVDVKKSMENPMESIENNVIATQNVLDACRKQDVKKIVFASTSTVYGNADKIPTSEDAELRPVSVYGATKAACEMLIRSYYETYGIDALILRYANIYGPGSRQGVVQDFVKKLSADTSQLEILGNGMQSKSYLYIDDAIAATLLAANTKGWNVFNIGSEKQTTVKEIAEMVIDAIGLTNVQLKFSNGVSGWPGDVPRFLLDVTKIKALGWQEKTDIRTGVRQYVEWLVRR